MKIVVFMIVKVVVDKVMDEKVEGGVGWMRIECGTALRL